MDRRCISPGGAALIAVMKAEVDEGVFTSQLISKQRGVIDLLPHRHQTQEIEKPRLRFSLNTRQNQRVAAGGCSHR